MLGGGGGQVSKNDASGFKQKGGAADILNAVNMEVTQDALISNVNEELQETAKAEAQNQLAEWEASRKVAQIEKDDDSDDDEFLDDKELQDLQSKRLADLQKKFALEKQFQAQGHGEYREISEEDFLKEVCGSQWVVVHFYHHEFFGQIVDKTCVIAQKHLSCKWLTLNAEKAPFFVSKLASSAAPSSSQDGVVPSSFRVRRDGRKDEFRTEVMEHWFSKAGCVIMKRRRQQMNEERRTMEGSDD